MKRRVAIAAATIVALSAAGFFVLAAPITDRQMNRVVRPKLIPKPSAAAEALMKAQPIVDLHADTLLWGRDLLAKNAHGHVDLPRLEAGGVGLQIFDAVTKTPRHLNIEKNDDSTDNVRLLGIAEHWPPRALTSLLARAELQADRLHEAAAASEGRLRVIGTRAELQALLDARKNGARTTGAMLGIEGAHALEGEVANLAKLRDKGFRVIGLAHFFDNSFAGSAHGVKKGGLSADGRALVKAIEENAMVVDLAHSSQQTIADVLALATRPVLVSHTGVRGTCSNARNLSDEQLRAIAKNGGLVGIGFWSTAVCGDDHAAIVRAVKHAIAIAGVDHVAFGSDYDGTVIVPFDASGLPELIQALLDANIASEHVAKIMGQNALRFFAAALP
ncbi:MAG: dipeptidase [Deltaproteobacteria bacterium]|nr:dipeptidase [Deltaproteobacteria bacterium]